MDSALAEYDYTYDAASQITQWLHHGETIDFTHDESGQLTDADYTTQADEDYAYDDNGNRTGTGMVIGDNNQVLSDGTYDYDYDAEGNLILKTDISSGDYTEYTYDHRNLMTSAKTYSSGDVLLQEVEFTYDLFDRRIAKTVDADGAGAGSPETIYTVYDGDHAWADFDESEAVVARYFFGDQIDDIVARWWPTEGTAWYLTDHLGTMHDLVDADGDLINTITYDSFGNIVSQTDPSAGDRFTYTGREYDAELDLYYYRARYYDAQLGRFASEDPIGFAAGDANLYRYVENNPVIYLDPSGLYSLGARMAIGGSAGVASGTAAGFAAGGIMGGPPGAAAGAIAGGIAGGIAGAITGAFMSPKASFGDLAAGGLAAGLAAGIGEGAAAGVAAAWAAGAAGGGAVGAAGAAGARGAAASGGSAGARGAAGAGGAAGARGAAGAGAAGSRSGAGKAAGAVDGWCFVAGTQVLMGESNQNGSIVGVRYAEAEVDDSTGWLTVVTIVIAGISPIFVKRLRRRKTDDALGLDEIVSHRWQEYLDDAFSDDSADLGDAATDRIAQVHREDWPNSGRVRLANTRQMPQCALIDRIAKPRRSIREGIWQSAWLAACLLIAAFLVARTGSDRGESPAPIVHATARSTSSKPSESVRVGMRVLTSAAEAHGHEFLNTEVDIRKWRRLKLRAQERWADGTMDSIEVETLQPPAWVAEHRAQPGAIVPLPLDLREMGLAAGLQARVVTNEPCPALDPGRGRVVMNTVSNLSNDVWELSVVTPSGISQAIRPTGLHRFYSATRNEWVSAKDLQQGERLHGFLGPVVVRSVAPVPGVHRVYNMTVEGEHVYRVSTLGVLVHNNGCAQPPNPSRAMTPDQRALKELVDEASNKGHKALSADDANTVLDWASEVNYPGWRASAADLATPSNWPGGGHRPHIHIEGVGSGHVPVQHPGVIPR